MPSSPSTSTGSIRNRTAPMGFRASPPS
jgi:hypothetical protein